MGELIGCFPLETVHPDMSSLSSRTRSSRSSILSRGSSSSSCSTTSTTLTVPDRLQPVHQHQKVAERLPPHTQGIWESAIATRWSANVAIDAPSQVSPFALAFRKVPDDVLGCIASHLALLRADNQYQATTRDLRSLCLTTSRWHKATRPQLYRKLWFDVSELCTKPRKFQLFSKTRLKLLRRTLKENPQLYNHVREIHVVCSQEVIAELTSKETRYCNDQLAAIIAPCENLEYLSGYKWTYTHYQNSLYRALSDKAHFKDLAWNIGANEGPRSEARFFLYPSTARPPLEDDQITSFVQFHVSMKNLESYSILGTADSDFHERMFDSFKHMPSLRRVSLSNLSESDFEDRHLQLLPSSVSRLSLDSIPGLSEYGLINYFTNHLQLMERSHLTQLDLTNVYLRSISGVSAILDHLYNLKRLKVVTSELSLDPDTTLDDVLHPLISSKSLQHLHWEHNELNSDCLEDEDDVSSTVADTILAEAILAEGFPNLKSVFAPSDTDGVIQSVCKPISRPLYRAATAGADLNSNTPLIKANDPQNDGVGRPLIHRATNAGERGVKRQISGQLRSTPDKSKQQAAAAYGRAADAIHPQRRSGCDAELGFRYNVLEAADPYITMYVRDETDALKLVVEFPQFLGRVGTNIPEYVLFNEAQ